MRSCRFKKSAQQSTLPFRRNGGRRAGAGRKPNGPVAALVYVLANGKKHAAEGREVEVTQAIDTFTSAPWFDGFRGHFTVRGIETIVRPVTDSRTWLLTIGWRRHGLLSGSDLPATA